MNLYPKEETLSQTFDYTGADIAQKRGDELSQLGSAQSKALMDGDLAASMAQRRRIKDLQGYINAYKGGGQYNGVFGAVAPDKRVASQSYHYDMGGKG
jgi:hypothetical protein